MATRFDWQVDEGAWPTAPSHRRPARRLPLRPRLLLLALPLALTLLLAVRQVERRVDETHRRLEADVRANYAILQTAARLGDGELFRSLLAEPDSTWGAVQQELFAAGLLLDRAPFDLFWQPPPGTLAAPAAPQVDSLTLSPELTAAHIVVRQTYLAAGEAGERPAIVLQQPAILAQRREGWRLAEPDEAFWGPQQQLSTPRLAVAFAERDAALARRLAADLDDLVARACGALAELACPPDLRLRLRLSAAPGSLLATTALTAMLGGGELSLPTPTLVGLPVDETGYQALLRAYGSRVAGALIAGRVGYRCCEQGLLFQALLDWLLADLGLRPWPLQAEHYSRLLNSPFSLAYIGQLWGEPFDPAREGNLWPGAYAAIEFTVRTFGVSPVAMLGRLQQLTFPQNWLYPYVDGQLNTLANEKWFQYIRAHSLAQAIAPPAEPPAQDVQLACFTGRSYARGIYRFDPVTRQLNEERLYRFTGFQFSPLPDDSGVIVQEHAAPGGPGQRTLIWQAGEAQVLADRAAGRRPVSYAGHNDPTGRRLVVRLDDAQADPPRYGLIDREACDAAGCRVKSLPGWPTWAPGGSSALIDVPRAGPEPPALWRATAEGNLLARVEQGSIPFWLDEATYGFARGNTVWIAAPGGAAAVRVVTRADLAAALPNGEDAVNLALSHLEASPGSAAAVLIQSRNLRTGTHAVFVLDRATAAVTLAFESDPGRAGEARFSPDGRWITLHVRDQNRAANTLYLYDRERGTTTEFRSILPLNGGYDWSADGRWLVKTDNYYLSLIIPETGYHDIFVYGPQMTCHLAAWVDRPPAE